jgi:hypothetical protein
VKEGVYWFGMFVFCWILMAAMLAPGLLATWALMKGALVFLDWLDRRHQQAHIHAWAHSATAVDRTVLGLPTNTRGH